MSRALLVAAAGLVLVLVAALFLALQREDLSGGVATPLEEVQGTRTITLLFPGARAGYIRESREIVGGEFFEEDVRTTVHELIGGSREQPAVRPLPPTTQLWNVFWDGEGELTLNFSDHLRSEHPGGSEAELATLRCVMSTLGSNFPEVDAVRFLIEGEVPLTLAGHVELTRPVRVADYR